MFGPLAARNSTGFPVRFTVTAMLIPSMLQPPDRPLSAGTGAHDVVAVETAAVSQASSWPLTGLVTEPLASAAAGSKTSPAAPARTSNFRITSSRVDSGQRPAHTTAWAQRGIADIAGGAPALRIRRLLSI